MAKSKRLTIRPAPQVGTTKIFKRVSRTKRRVTATKVHPLIVLKDLRRGSLVSLDKYIAQQKGIPDREVALELRKLISGSHCRTSFRLFVADHPDLPRRTGGRPPSSGRPPNKREIEIAEDFLRVRAQSPYEAALAEVSRRQGVSTATVASYVRRVSDFAQRQIDPEQRSNWSVKNLPLQALSEALTTLRAKKARC